MSYLECSIVVTISERAKTLPSIIPAVPSPIIFPTANGEFNGAKGITVTLLLVTGTLRMDRKLLRERGFLTNNLTVAGVLSSHLISFHKPCAYLTPLKKKALVLR